MTSAEVLSSNVHLEEFSSNYGNSNIFYQIMRMEGMVYVWVGTEQADMGGLTAAYGSRLENMGPAVSSLLGPTGDSYSGQLAERLQRRIRKHVLLSVNVSDEGLHSHIEDMLVERLVACQEV